MFEKPKTIQSRGFKWAVRFAWIFGICGITGSVYLLCNTDAAISDSVRKTDTLQLQAPGNNKAIYTDTLARTQSLQPATDYTSAPAHEPAGQVEKSKNTVTESAGYENTETIKAEPPPVKHTELLPVSKPAIAMKTYVSKKKTAENKKIRQPPPAVKAVDKILTDGDLDHLLTRIITKGDDNAVYAKCVQLQRTALGNNKNTTRQIEAYLRSHQYAIAGREIVTKNIKGIKVSPAKGCMKVTIGSF